MAIFMDEMILNLKVIGRLTDKCTLNVSTGEPVIQQVGFVSSVVRFLSGESRTKTLEFVQKTFQTCESMVGMTLNSTFLQMSKSELITSYQRSRALEMVASLSAVSLALESSIKGLNALGGCYKDDFTICAKLDILKTKGERLVLSIAQSIERVEVHLRSQKTKIIRI